MARLLIPPSALSQAVKLSPPARWRSALQAVIMRSSPAQVQPVGRQWMPRLKGQPISHTRLSPIQRTTSMPVFHSAAVSKDAVRSHHPMPPESSFHCAGLFPFFSIRQLVLRIQQRTPRFRLQGAFQPEMCPIRRHSHRSGKDQLRRTAFLSFSWSLDVYSRQQWLGYGFFMGSYNARRLSARFWSHEWRQQRTRCKLSIVFSDHRQ